MPPPPAVALLPVTLVPLVPPSASVAPVSLKMPPPPPGAPLARPAVLPVTLVSMSVIAHGVRCAVPEGLCGAGPHRGRWPAACNFSEVRQKEGLSGPYGVGMATQSSPRHARSAPPEPRGRAGVGTRIRALPASGAWGSRVTLVPIGALSAHPLAARIPTMSGAERALLGEDIARGGIQAPWRRHHRASCSMDATGSPWRASWGSARSRRAPSPPQMRPPTSCAPPLPAGICPPHNRRPWRSSAASTRERAQRVRSAGRPGQPPMWQRCHIGEALT